MLKQLFSKSEFTKNTFTLIIGTVIAQSIPLLLHPVLRRIYAPEDFGAMSVYLSIFSMLTIVLSLRYEATIVLPKNNNEAANILGLTFVVNISITLVAFLTVLLFKEEIAELLNFPEKYSAYLYFLPLGASLFALYQSINFWLIRQKAFKASTSNKIIRRVVEGATQLGLGLLKIPGGLISGDIVGNLANVIAGIRQSLKKVVTDNDKTYYLTGPIKNTWTLERFITKKKMAYAFKRYIEYPKYNVIPTLLSTAATTLPFLFINKMYGPDTLGYIDLSRLVLSIPLIFISATISQVFFQQTTEKKHLGQSIHKDCMNILHILLAITAMEIIIIFTFGTDLFAFVFSEKYALSGDYAKILMLSFILNFIGSTFSSIFITFEKIKYNSIWQVLYFAAICSLALIDDLGIISFLKLYVLIEVIMHSLYLFMVFWIVRNYENKICQE
ncbi:MAG: lipopolysaccharide biosynthesis protein [Flavobacteriales bacterium]